MSKNKPKWNTPKLITLVKSRQEERVLTSCKNGGGFSPDSNFGSCEYYENECHFCSDYFGS